MTDGLLARLGRSQAPVLPAGIHIAHDWPARLVAVVTATPHAGALGTLERFGFTPRVVDPRSPSEVARQIGTCTFVLIGSDALAVDSGELVAGFRRMSPYAPLLFLHHGHATIVESAAAMKAGVSAIVDPADQVGFAEVITSQLRVAGKRRERVLAIGASPDVIALGCAGALLSHRRRGDRVSLLTLGGEVPNTVPGRTGSGERWQGDDRPGDAASSSVQAARSIGAQLLVARLKGGALDHNGDALRMVHSVVAALDPTVVYIHAENDADPDHRSAHRAATSAVPEVPQMFGYRSATTPHAFTPTRFVPIDDFVAHKVDVLRLLGSLEGGSCPDPEFAVSDARQWARHVAQEARFVEPFEIIRCPVPGTYGPPGSRYSVEASTSLGYV